MKKKKELLQLRTERVQLRLNVVKRTNVLVMASVFNQKTGI